LFGNSLSGIIYWYVEICHIDSPDLAVSVCADFNVEEAHVCIYFFFLSFVVKMKKINRRTNSGGGFLLKVSVRYRNICRFLI
jgi:hypothetical protein